MKTLALPSLFACLVALALTGCKTAASAEAPDTAARPETPFAPTGSVTFLGGNASFDQTYVRGPLINAERRANGDWAGKLEGQALDVSVDGDRVVGAYLSMKIKKNAGGYLVTGNAQNGMFHFEMKDDVLTVRMPNRSLTLHKTGEGRYGPRGELTLTGDAAKAEPPMPQMALALLATFSQR